MSSSPHGSRPLAAFVARWGAVGAMVSAVLLGAPAAAFAHATLVRADPPVHGHLTACPPRVRLEFNEAIEPSMAGISIISADGRRISLALAGDPHDVHAVVAPTPCLGNGVYHVMWRAVSDDGHPVDGSYAFVIGANVALDTSMGAEGMRMSAHDSAMTAEGEGMMHHESANWGPSVVGAPIGQALLRGLAIGVLLAFAGLLFFRSGAATDGLDRAMRVAQWLAVLSPLLLLAHFAFWVINTNAQHVLNANALHVVASTGMGQRELLRIGLSLIALWAFSLARRPAIALGACVAALLVSSTIGHSAAIAPMWTIPGKALHLLASGAWIGGVVWLLTLDRGDATRFAHEATRVSRVALWCVVVVSLSGLLQACFFLTAPSDLVHSPYGLLVLAKFAGTLVLVGFGAHHRMRTMRKTGDTQWTPVRLASTLRGEILVMMLVALMGGLLSYVPLPQSMPSMNPSATEP